MSLTWTESIRLGAKGGPPDRLRRWLIAGCAALGTLLLATAASIPTFWSADGGIHGQSVLGRVLGNPELGRNAMIGLALLVIPIVHFTAQAVRVGAPARDRRLAAMRTAGATRGDVRSVVRAETLVWALPGSLLGLGLYAVLIALAPRWTVPVVEYGDFGSTRVSHIPIVELPHWPHPLLLLSLAVVVPLAAAAIVPVVIGRVAVGEGAQQQAERTPSARLALTLGVGTVLAAGVLALALVLDPYAGGRAHWYSQPLQRALDVLVLAAPILLLLTILTVAPVVTSRLGRWLSRRGGASWFIAGRMMQARPRLASRTAVSLVLVALVGGVAVTLGGPVEAVVSRNAEAMNGTADVPEGAMSGDVLFYTVPFVVVQALAVLTGLLAAVGLLIAVAEQVALRGPALARQVAMGVPRSVLRRALVVEVVAPVVLMTTVVLGVAVLFAALMASGMEAGALSGIHWGRLVVFWLVLVGGATVAAWVGGLALPATVAPQRIRDRG